MIACQASLSTDIIYNLMFFDTCSLVSFDSSKKYPASSSQPTPPPSYPILFLFVLSPIQIDIIAHLFQGL